MGVHLAVADMAKAMDFYRRAGLAIPEGASEQPHIEIEFEGGAHVAFSTPMVMAMYDPAWRGPSPATATALQFRLPSRAAVDDFFETVRFRAAMRDHLEAGK